MVVDALSEQALVDFIVEQRWYAGKSREIVRAAVVDAVTLREDEPRAVVALVKLYFQAGTHETYQMLLCLRPAEEGWSTHTIAEGEGWTAYEGLADPIVASRLLSAMQAGTTLEGGEGTIDLGLVEGLPKPDRVPLEVHPIGAEQSNSSLVFGRSLLLKAYRRLDAGPNPELEMLRFLTLRGFPNIPALRGWYDYHGQPIEATLGILQDFVPSRSDGWAFALDALRFGPEEFVASVRRLGEITGAMHSVLASDHSDPDFAPEEPSGESLGLLVASIEEEVGHVFRELPDGLEALAPIAGRGADIRSFLYSLSRVGSIGQSIRHHGDYHLGQVLWTGEDWIVIDFEGEPARPFSERRQKRSPLRDVAGMMRSFAYAGLAAPILHGIESPDGFEARLRGEFLEGYLAEVDARLLPPYGASFERLLTLFELEKAIYELRYELDNRPEWLSVPVAGITRLLASEQA